MRLLTPVLAVALLVSAAGARGGANGRAAAEWPGWRGPGQSGAVNGGTFSFAAGDGLRVAWKRPLGTGYSSVSIAGGHAVTLFGDGRDDYVVSLEPRTGRERWRFRIGPTFKAPIQSNDGPVSTPVIHEGAVFALGPHGRLVALDLETGRLAWSRDLVGDFGAEVPYFGFATSPIAAGRHVYVEAGGKSASLVAFDARTGATAWSAGTDSVTYQSPVLATLAGERQIVFAGDAYLHGVRPETGEVLWTREHGVRADPEAVKQIVLGPGDLNPISPVIVGDDGVLLTNYYGANSVLFRIAPAAEQYAVSEAWRNTNIRKTYTVPVAAGGHLYGFTNRFAVCVDARTGEMAWRSRPPGDGWVIAVDERLIFVTKDEGAVHVAHASPDGYRELASAAVFDNLTWTPPSYANGLIFVRNFREIAAVEVVPGGATATAETTAAPTGSAFGRFIQRVNAAPLAEREALVAEYLKTQTQIPIIEGDRTVHIVFRGDVRDVAVEGDMLEAGEQAPMARVEGTDFYHATFSLEPDARVDYKISKDYKSELVVDPLNPRRVAVPGSEYSEIVMPRWQPPPYATTTPAVRGTIERLDLESRALGRTRAAEVYLPPGYAATADPYPVLYVTDGRRAREFGKLTETLDILIGSGRIRPVIAVLLDPAPFEELAGSARDRHAEMLARELVPRIDQAYRTRPEPAHRAVMGADRAGYAATYAAFRYPGTFTQVAGQSTYLFGPAGGDELTRLVTASPRLDVRFFFGWGKYDVRGRGVQRREGLMDWRQDSIDFVRLLSERKYDVTGLEVSEGWGWASWRNYTHRILEFFFGR